MDKVKEIAGLVYKSPKVRLAAKGLLIAVAGVIAGAFGLGDAFINVIAGF